MAKTWIKQSPSPLCSNNPPPRFKQPLPPLCSNNPGIPLSGVQTTPPPRFKQPPPLFKQPWDPSIGGSNNPPPFVQTTLGSLYRGYQFFFSHIFSLDLYEVRYIPQVFSPEVCTPFFEVIVLYSHIFSLDFYEVNYFPQFFSNLNCSHLRI